MQMEFSKTENLENMLRVHGDNKIDVDFNNRQSYWQKPSRLSVEDEINKDNALTGSSNENLYIKELGEITGNRWSSQLTTFTK